MKATVMFDRQKLRWTMVSLHLCEGLYYGSHMIKSKFSSYGIKRYTHVMDVKIKSFEMIGENRYEWVISNLPDTPTIEDCIAENRRNIRESLAYLKAGR